MYNSTDTNTHVSMPSPLYYYTDTTEEILIHTGMDIKMKRCNA